MARKNSVAKSPLFPSEDDYRQRDDHETLARAEDIRQDPKRMAGARKHARKQIRNIQRVHGRSVGR